MTALARRADQPAVVIVGHVCIDENTDVDESTGAGVVHRVVGSSAYFMTEQLRAGRGAAVSIVAPYGADLLALTGALPLLTEPMAADTLLYRNHLHGEARSQECFNARHALPVPIGERERRVLSWADIVVVCPLLANFGSAYVDSVLAPVPDAALKVLLVQGYLRSIDSDGSVSKSEFTEYADIIGRFDLAVFSNEDMDDALATAAEWSMQFPRTVVVVTENREGASYFEGGVGHRVAAAPLHISGSGNVVGAGDVFSAALALSYGQSRSIRGAMVEANAAAAAFIDGARQSAVAAT